MRTSNKIIIAIVVIMLGGIITLYIFAKYIQNEPKPIEKKDYTVEKITLKPFSVIVANDSSNVQIFHSVNFSIDIIHKSSEKMGLRSAYELRKDTLFLYKGNDICVCCNSIRTIIGNNHLRLSVRDQAPELLTFKLKGGKTDLNNYNIKNKQTSITVIAGESSKIVIENVNTRIIDINSTGGSIELYCKSKLIKAKLLNSSYLTIGKNPEKLDMVRDSSSTITMSYNPNKKE